MKNLKFLILIMLSIVITSNANTDLSQLGLNQSQNKQDEDGDTRLHLLSYKCDYWTTKETQNKVLLEFLKNSNNIPNPFIKNNDEKTAFDEATDCDAYRLVLMALQFGYAQGHKDTINNME